MSAAEGRPASRWAAAGHRAGRKSVLQVQPPKCGQQVTLPENTKTNKVLHASLKESVYCGKVLKDFHARMHNEHWAVLQGWRLRGGRGQERNKVGISMEMASE